MGARRNVGRGLRTETGTGGQRLRLLATDGRTETGALREGAMGFRRGTLFRLASARTTGISEARTRIKAVGEIEIQARARRAQARRATTRKA